MAENDIVRGLFGPTPYEVEQQQREKAYADSRAYGMMTHQARNIANERNTGYEIGQTLGKMVGYVDPERQKAQKVQDLLRNSDLTSQQGLRDAARMANQMGLSDTALQLSHESDALSKKQADYNLVKAHTAYYNKGGVSSGSLAKLASKQAIARHDAYTEGINGGLSGDALEKYIQKRVDDVTETWLKTTGEELPGAKQQIPVSSIPEQQPIVQQSTISPTDTAVNNGTPFIQDAPMVVTGAPDMQPAAQPIAPFEMAGVPVQPQVAQPVAQSIVKPVAQQVSRQHIPLKGKVEMAGAVKKAQEDAQLIGAVGADGRAIFTTGKNAIGMTPLTASPALKANLESAGTTGKTTSEKNDAEFTQAKEAKMSLPKINNLISRLESSDGITGLGADLIKNLNRFKAFLGSAEGAKTASSAELLDAYMGSEVFPLIHSLGIGAKGMDTPAEREFMRAVLTGTITLNKNTLLEMAKLRKGAAEGLIDNFNNRVKSGELDPFFRDSGRNKEPISYAKSQTLDLSSPDKIKAVQDQIRELRLTDPNGANQLLYDLKAQIKKPPLTKEEARRLFQERGYK